MANENKRKQNIEFERQQLFNFFEELCWLLDSNKELNFKSASKYLREIRNAVAHSMLTNESNSEYRLIGILPSLLKDEEIFPSNAQLVQFADEVLSLPIPRWEKRSRNEIVGLIICEVEDANKERLSLLVDWSENILYNKSKVKELQSKAKSTGNIFSWNETIQRLVGTKDE